MAASRVICLVLVACTAAQSTLENAMHRDDECFGQQQEACTLAMLQRHPNAEQEGRLAVSADEEEALAMATEKNEVAMETPSEAEGRHSPAVSKASKKAEGREDLLKPNSTKGGDRAYNSSDSMVGVPEVPWSRARVDQTANSSEISKLSDSSVANSSDSDFPEANAAGNITEPAELANAMSAEVSKSDAFQATNSPGSITVRLVPDLGPPMDSEEMLSSSAEQTPPSAEEVLPLSEEEEVPLLPAAEEDEAAAEDEDEAISEAAAVADEEAEAEASAEADAQEEDEAESEADARAVAKSETVHMPESEDLGGAPLDADEDFGFDFGLDLGAAPLGLVNLDESGDFGA